MRSLPIFPTTTDVGINTTTDHAHLYICLRIYIYIYFFFFVDTQKFKKESNININTHKKYKERGKRESSKAKGIEALLQILYWSKPPVVIYKDREVRFSQEQKLPYRKINKKRLQKFLSISYIY